MWGRGGIGFGTFFWDGKVDFSDEKQISQFGDDPPSSDALVVAVHLPPVEIREMLEEDLIVKKHKKEDVQTAKQLYTIIVDNFLQQEKALSEELAKSLGKDKSDIEFIDIARAIAAFIRSEFRIERTQFHEFVFNNGKLINDEISGGLLFYGKGKCATCHSGPYFSDFKFHAIAFPQLGFGKNGFGVDYGRFNVTFDPTDIYKFRTPPLYNVAETAPYGHSGSINDMGKAILYHSDPLRFLDIKNMDQVDRTEYYKRLSRSSDNILQIGLLDKKEILDLVIFLRTLNLNEK